MASKKIKTKKAFAIVLPSAKPGQSSCLGSITHIGFKYLSVFPTHKDALKTFKNVISVYDVKTQKKIKIVECIVAYKI